MLISACRGAFTASRYFSPQMPKLKSRKAAVKRLRLTKRGKITRAKAWAGPYRGRKSRRARRAKGHEQPVVKGPRRQALRLLAN